jgi:hypothetical protein
MNPIEEAIRWLNILLACAALSADEQRVNGTDYLLQNWVCQTSQGPVHVAAWRKWCETNGYKYLGRPFFMEYKELHEAEYINRFGEVQRGEGAQVMNAYQPPCGS